MTPVAARSVGSARGEKYTREPVPRVRGTAEAIGRIAATPRVVAHLDPRRLPE